MKLDKVQIQHFRNLSHVVVNPDEHLNLFIGNNGSGKSSFLEALHYLSCGRSFRTNKFTSLIQHEQSKFVLFAGLKQQPSGISDVSEFEIDQIESKLVAAKSCKIGISRERNGVADLRIDGEKHNKISALAQLLPTLVFTPQSSDLLTGSPVGRRSFLDWGVFHVEQSYLNIVSVFNKLLKQRNAFLKSRELDSKQLSYWDQQFCLLGDRVTSYRDNYLTEFTPYFSAQIAKFLPEFSFEIAYYRGWERGIDLLECLNKHAVKDRAYGFTGVGPHKADIKIKVDSKPVQEVLSRGQLRLLASAMYLAQSQLLLDKRNVSCVYLLDDIGAELDETKRLIFVDHLINTKAQVFITATDMQQLDFLNNFSSKKVFHVEHGQVNEEK